MIKEINLDGKIIQYEFFYKNVKNINLRIKPDAGISVSANRRVPFFQVESFIISKKNFILNTLNSVENKLQTEKKQYFKEDEIEKIITEICEKVYPDFEKQGIEYPEIRFKKMISQWGNCNTKKKILTFNLNLMYAPLECIEYVVFHEFTHFLQPNHSYKFYEELEKSCPEWKFFRRKLKEINIR